MDIKPDYEVNDEEALLNLISKISKRNMHKNFILIAFGRKGQ